MNNRYVKVFAGLMEFMKKKNELGETLLDVASKLAEIEEPICFVGTIAAIIDVWQEVRGIPDEDIDPILETYITKTRKQVHAKMAAREQEDGGNEE